MADGTIRVGAIDGSSGVKVPGILRYTGSAAAQSDRQIQLEGDGARITPADDAGSLTLNGDIFSNNAALGQVNLVLGGTGSHEVGGDIYEIGTMVRVVKVDSGTWRLSGNNSYTGQTLNLAGRLIVDTHSLPAAGGIVSNGDLEFDQTTIAAYDGLISGTGDVIKSGDSSSLTLTATNTYTGNTIIAAGSIGINSIANVGAVSPIGKGNTVRVGGVVGQSAGLVYNGPAASTNRNYVLESDGDPFISSLNSRLSMSGVVSGTNSLFEIRGQLELTGTNTYTAETSILDFSTLSVPEVTDKFVPGPLGAGEKIRLISGSTLQFTGMTGSTDRDFTLDHLANSSAVDVTNGELTLVGEIVSGDSGSGETFEKLGAGTLVIARPNGNGQFHYAMVVQAGTLLVNNTTGSGTGTGDVTVEASATLGGSGSIAGSVALHDSATLAPAASTGTLSVGGDVSFADLADLSIEIGGRGEGEFDVLDITGSATLAGILDVSLLGDFLPAVGNTFEILTSTGGVGGVFANESFPDLGALLTMDALYDDNSVTLAVVPTLAGDYNANGVVDAADYTVWRDELGQSGLGLAADGTGADGIPDGVVDPLDYQFWKDRFGDTLGSASLSKSAVPEPASFVLWILAAVGCRHFERMKWPALVRTDRGCDRGASAR